MARQRLIDRRNELGMTQEDVAHHLGIDVGTVARWERGVNKPRPSQRPELAELYRWTLAQLDYAFKADDDAPLNGQAVPTWLSLHAALEQSAACIWVWQPFVVHALLQTPDYAAAVERADVIPKSEEGIARRVEVRMARQRVLDRDDPLVLSVLLDESVLLRTTGGPDVMTTQLEHLVDATQRPNVHLRVLPLDAGRHGAAFGSFTVIATQGSDDPQIVCVENRTGMSYLEGTHPVDAHVEVFEHLWENALSPEATADLIRHIAKESSR